MRLNRLIITGYKSINGLVPLLLNQKVTVLIGANDHGKTNLLNAIHCLNDDKKIAADDKNWDLPAESMVRLEWEFDLSEEELRSLREYELKDEKDDKKQETTATSSVAPQDATPATQPVAPKEPIFELSEKKIIYFRDSKDNVIKVKSTPFRIPISKEAELLKLRPHVEFFESPTGNVVDQITLAELEQNEFEFMQGIFRLAGLWDNRKEIFTQTDETSKLLDEAGAKLTKTLNDNWNQGRNLIWKLEHTGTNGNTIIIKIQDPSINKRYSRPSLRSSGFRTFFLLSMITMARTKNNTKHSYIFLFDEPGTYLHPYAQLDLQRSFESISENTQIIYTTHSVFLVNKNYPERNRVVSKHIDGTKIDQKPFLKNWKSVRDSLGILLSNNFLIAEKTLLVEGPSDVIYLLGAIKQLKKEGLIDVDLNDLSIVDSGTSENYLAMAKLMLSEGRSVIALLDGDKSGGKIKDQLAKVCESEIKEKRLQIYCLPPNKSIEDITVDITQLRDSVKQVAEYLETNKLRVKIPSIDFAKAINKIDFSQSKTLGAIIDDESKTFFDDNEKISKLSIALMYEDLGSSKSTNPEAKKHIDAIQSLLNLRGEKASDAGIFDIVQ